MLIREENRFFCLLAMSVRLYSGHFKDIQNKVYLVDSMSTKYLGK